MEKINLNLDGLGCASCAAKIESKSKEISGVENLVLDFSRSKLSFETDSNNTDILIEQIKHIVHTLEPEVVISQAEPSQKMQLKYVHDRKELYRLLVSLALFAIALFIGNETASILLLLIAYLLSGYKVLSRSFRNIRHGDIFDENFLMSLATFGAIAIGEYPEAVAVMIFYEIGEYFQDLAVIRSKNAIGSLMDIRPDLARVKRGDQWLETSPEDVSTGDIIQVKPGERIPLDGTVIKGAADVDASALTGESLPVHMSFGSTVLSGSVVKNAVLEISTTATYKESTVSRILDLVENATQHKSPTENFITKFARYYTPIVVFFALGLAFIPPFLLGMGTFDTWLYRSLIFLVISCPCALVVSVPLGFFSGIGNASSHGILVKGSNYLEALNEIDTVVFDKTGTLTEGKFEVADVYPSKEIPLDMLLKYAVVAESHSNHPIAKSIVQYARNYKGSLEPNHYEELSGKGVIVTTEEGVIRAGNLSLMEENNIPVTPLDSPYTVVYVALNETYLGAIDIRDKIKPDSAHTINSLTHMNIETVMLTGDRAASAKSVGDSLAIDEIKSQLLPEDKYHYVMNLIDSGKKVAFIGDGINDAPVLAGATVGISMGSIGSDAAIEASDIVFMTDEPSKLIHAMKIAGRTKRIVVQNIIFALGTKLLIMALGVFGLSSMWMAIFADVGVALIAVLNSVRVLHYKS